MPIDIVKPIVIGIDIDDTVALSAPMVIAHSNKVWGTTLTVDDYHEDWAKMWGVDYDEVSRRANEYFASGILRRYEAMPSAEKVLTVLKEKYSLLSVTSRNKNTTNDTISWIGDKYCGIFDDNRIFFMGAWDVINEESVLQTKGQKCKELGVDILIDDQLKHCLSAAELGIKALLFGDYSWNQVDNLPPNVTRVRNWAEVLEYFNEQF